MIRFLVNLFRRSRQPIFEPRLYGTWRSDAAATLDYLRTDPRCTEQVVAAVGRIVGRLRVTVGPDTVTLESCELAGTYTYRVVKKSRQGVVIEITSDNWRGQRRRSTITFVEDGHWVDDPDPRLPWFREKFVRVSDPSVTTLPGAASR